MSLPDERLPEVFIEFDGSLDAAPIADNLWDDFTGETLSISVRRGRQHELSRPEASTMTIVFDNRKQYLDPDNTASPYTGKVLPMKRIRVRVEDVVGGGFTSIFNGYIERYTYNFEMPNNATCTVECVDPLRLLSHVKITKSYSSQAAWVTFGEILSDAGLNESQSIALDTTTVPAFEANNATALDLLNRVAEGTGGAWWWAYGNTGRIEYKSKETFVTASEFGTSQATWGFGVGELPYTDLTLTLDEADIYNYVSVTRAGSAGDVPTEQTASDSSSINAYLERRIIKTDVLVNNDAEALSLAQYLLHKSKTPYQRVRSMEIMPQADSAIWDEVLGDTHWYRYTLKFDPPGSGDTIEHDYHHIGTSIDWEPGLFRVSWDLIASGTSDYWVLDDANLSVLGTDATTPGTTVLMY